MILKDFFFLWTLGNFNFLKHQMASIQTVKERFLDWICTRKKFKKNYLAWFSRRKILIQDFEMHEFSLSQVRSWHLQLEPRNVIQLCKFAILYNLHYFIWKWNLDALKLQIKRMIKKSRKFTQYVFVVRSINIFYIKLVEG